MSLRKVTLFSCLFFFIHTQLSAQCNQIIDIDRIKFEDLLDGYVSQSSTIGEGFASLAFDNNTSGSWADRNVSRTGVELHPWWQVDLGSKYYLNSIKLFYPLDLYPNGFSDYYIQISDVPFSSEDLNTTLASPNTSYFYVENSLPSGEEIVLGSISGQYIRIQSADQTFVSLTEAYLFGAGGDEEICGNGEDDDCDGDIDCDDSECGPILLNQNVSSASCEMCWDAILTMQISEITPPLSISYDGGISFTNYSTNDNTVTLQRLLEPNVEYDIIITDLSGCEIQFSVTADIEEGVSGLTSCDNGGFEEGNFDGWTGTHQADHTSDPSPVVETELNPAFPAIPHWHQFVINDSPSSYAIGSYVPFDILHNNPDGRFFARINNSRETGTGQNRSNATLEYCFNVDASNSNFHFFYLVELQDGNDFIPHTPSQQAKAGWEVRINNELIPGLSNTIIANNNNPIFSSVFNDSNLADNIIYTPWICQEYDLSSYIGSELCIEFFASDCTHQHQHAGIMYVDGLCFKDPTPIGDFDLNQYYCLDQTVSAIPVGTKNINSYSWRVRKLDQDGSVAATFFTDVIYSSIVTPFEDILGWFWNPPHNPSQPLTCNDRFEVTLILNNSCDKVREITKEFTYVCEELYVNYPDIYTCLTDEDITIPGIAGDENNACNGCSYEWTPGEFLNDPTLSNPTILASLIGAADNQTYNVTVTNEIGCQIEDQVDIFNLHFDEIDFSATAALINVDYPDMCTFYPEFEITFDEEIDPVPLTVEIVATSDFVPEPGAPAANSGNYTSTLISDASPGKTHLFKSDIGLDRLGSWTFQIRIYYNNSGGLIPGGSTVIGNCILEVFQPTILVPIHSFHKNSIYIPGVFSPNGDGIHDFFFPFFGNDSGIFQARVKVFDENGGFLFDSGLVEAPLSGPGLKGDEPQLRWDGTLNGVPEPTEVYTYVISYTGCLVDLPCSDCNFFNLGDCDACEPYDYNISWGNYGSVQLF